MHNLDGIEREVWKQIQAATEARDTKRLGIFSPLAAEIETKKKDWLARLDAGLKMNGTAVHAEEPRVPISASTSRDEDFTGRPITGFEFDGMETRVTTYKDLLVRFSNVLRRKHGREFDRRAVTLAGRKRPYFSARPGDLKFAHELDGGGLYVETNLNANLIVKICHWLLTEFGGNPASLRIH